MKNRVQVSWASIPGWVLLALLAFFLAIIACGRGATEPTAPATPEPPSAASEQGTLLHGGLERTYRLRLPAGYQALESAPLVLALHGGGGDQDQMCDLPGSLAELVDREGFLLLCPQGIGGHWNDGRTTNRYRVHRQNIDDVGYLLALLARVEQDYVIDPDRVYVTGASNGGMMTYRLACQAPERFAAAAAIIANLPLDLICEPERPIAIMMMNGSEDPLMPYGGGQVQFLGRELGAVRSAPETAQFWGKANGCQPPAEIRELEDTAPGDGTRIRLERYGDCESGSEVLFYTVVGGGHTWPGGPRYAGERLIGPISQDGHMGELVWAFFARHSVGGS